MRVCSCVYLCLCVTLYVCVCVDGVFLSLFIIDNFILYYNVTTLNVAMSTKVQNFPSGTKEPLPLSKATSQYLLDYQHQD